MHHLDHSAVIRSCITDLTQADFFLKADPDSYVMVDNLKAYLSHRNTSIPEIYGHALWFPGWNITYVAGGCVVLTKQAVKLLVTEALVKYPGCFTPGHGLY